MEKVISVSLGELALKGSNRKYFEDQLIKQIMNKTKDIRYDKLYKEQGKIYIEANEEKFESLMEKLKNVFGLVYISPCIRVEKDIEAIEEACILNMKERLEKDPNIKTFKVDTNRADKNFAFTSPEISREIGKRLLNKFDNLNVDVHNPDLYMYIDIKQTHAYIYSERIKAYGGMPIGTSGKALLLISGGIDSPVAGFMMAKRGVSLSCVHYHSYPFTSERGEEKVKELAKKLSMYTGKIKFYSVNILNIQKEINEKCPEKEMTIISRKFMMRIAEKIARYNKLDALITGESLGQVASQTMQGLTVTDESVSIPVFRPLIGMDKVDIIEIARDIDTLETSNLPFEDCCTVFLPKHPVTNPSVENIKRSEEALDVETLVKDAIDNMKVYIIK
ncbi:tRNA uracil 4-sulfurtransferase ThiI [Tissierella creatinophila]|uniref:Probable tRNA sulfurtransferase n=1 Tax=Tissierella creatinophila DSM 6911 TaxID=1123403 RepID=A0A1U7M6Q8_TISCR|nr:tRNA uracil 4-sulfurtransferase ThiI [Tissierella creatinophila]OLS02940.1 putative tRNA sulfurtransferase [Tissierella creatinophila DSM 6911]